MHCLWDEAAGVEPNALDCICRDGLRGELAAVAARTTRKYGERGIRYVHMEAGYAAQNALLTAAALGLAAYPVGAFDDARVGRLLRLGRGEAAVYIVPVGARGYV